MRFAACLVLVLTIASPPLARAQPFLTARDVDLTALLPPPPAPETTEAKAELAAVLSAQVTRTPALEAQAVADAWQTLAPFAATLGLGEPLPPLPRTRAFIARLEETESAVTDPSKAVWARPRPHQLSDLVRPVGRLSKSGSYPSGHAAFGTLLGIELAAMVPERRAALMARAREYGDNRVLAGNHFPSDVAAGRMAGTAIAAVLAGRGEFEAALGEARAELRSALDLPPVSP